MEDIGEIMTDEERVLKYIIDLVQNKNTNKVDIYRDPAIRITGLKESDIVRSLHFLQSDEYLRIVRLSTNNDLSIPCSIELYASGFHYFDKKNEKEVQERINSNQFIISILISAFALFISAIK